MTISYQVIPNLRSKFVADDGREFDMHAAWEWFDGEPDRWRQLFFGSGVLNRSQCRSLWRWLGRTDPVPKRLEVFFLAEDIQRLWPRPRH
jgi:hypothetical protein